MNLYGGGLSSNFPAAPAPASIGDPGRSLRGMIAATESIVASVTGYRGIAEIPATAVLISSVALPGQCIAARPEAVEGLRSPKNEAI